MPAYHPLSDTAPQDHAVAAAHADALRAAGRHAEAIGYLLGVVEQLERLAQPVPAWPYGRLALLYRHLRAFDDEVRVLERYQSLVPDGAHRSRFAARLSKARALADRRYSTVAVIKLRA